MHLAPRRRTPSARAARAVIAVAALAALAALASGCSEVEQAARDTASEAAGDATCTVARTAADEVRTQTSAVLDRIGADPAAAKRELEALRATVVAATTTGISQDAKDSLGRLETALDDLIAQADAAREGTPVDEQAVDRAQEDLDAAVSGVRDAC